MVSLSQPIRRRSRGTLVKTLFAWWPSRRRNVRIVKGSALRQRGLGTFGHVVVQLLLCVAEYCFTRWFLKSRAVHNLVSQLHVMDVNEIWSTVHKILDRIAEEEQHFLPRTLSALVHFRGRLTKGAGALVMAPCSGHLCLKYRWKLIEHYIERQTVTKRRKLPKRRKSRRKTKRSKSDQAASSDESSSDSEYEEWEEDITVDREETIDSGEGASQAPYAVVDKSAQSRAIMVNNITNWGGEELVDHATDDAAITGVDLVLAPLTKRLKSHLERYEYVVFDGAVFEGVGKLVVDLHPSNGILVPTVARLVAPHDTAKQHLSILREGQELGSLAKAVQSGSSIRESPSIVAAPGETLPYAAESLPASCETEGTGLQSRHRRFQYLWSCLAVVSLLLRFFSARALLRKISPGANGMRSSLLVLLAVFATSSARHALLRRR